MQDAQRRHGVLYRHCRGWGSSHLLGDAVKNLVVMRNSVLVNLALLRLNSVPLCTEQKIVMLKLCAKHERTDSHWIYTALETDARNLERVGFAPSDSRNTVALRDTTLAMSSS